MPKVCIHLDENTHSDYAHSFTGVGVDYALVCLECREDLCAIETKLKVVSPERFAHIGDDGCWEWDEKSIVGKPQVLERCSDLMFHHQDIALVGDILEGIVDLRPIPLSGSAE